MGYRGSSRLALFARLSQHDSLGTEETTLLRHAALFIGGVVVLAAVVLALRFGFTDDASSDSALSAETPASSAELAVETSRDFEVSAAADAPTRNANAPSHDSQSERVQVAAPTLPVLRIVEADGVTPRAAFALEFLFWGEVQDDSVDSVKNSRAQTSKSSLVTDDAGLIALGELLEADPTARWLQVRPADSDLVALDPNVLDVDALRAKSDAPIVLVLRELPAAPVRALAVDQETGDALPQLALRLHEWSEASTTEAPTSLLSEHNLAGRRRSFEGDDQDWVITDEQGYLTTRHSLAAGKVEFMTIDHEPAQLDHDPSQADASPPRLEVPVGPVIRLDFRPDRDRSHSDYVAGQWRDPQERMRTYGLKEFSSPWSPDRGAQEAWGNLVAVMPGNPPWVRLAQAQLEDPLPSFLYLVSRDGRSMGFARFESYAAHRDVPLHVDLVEREALTVLLQRPPEENSREVNVRLELHSVDSTEPESTLFVRLKKGELQATAAYPWREAGAYRLKATGLAIEPMELDVALPAAEPVELTLRLEPEEELHSVRVQLATRTGRPLDGKDGRASLKRLVLLNSDRTGKFRHFANVKWGAQSGTSSPIEVTAGSYSCVPSWSRGGFELDSATVEFSVPGHDPRVIVLDDVRPIWLEVRVFDPPPKGILEVMGRHPSGFYVGSAHALRSGDDLPELAEGRRALVLVDGPFDPEVLFELEFSADDYLHESIANARIPAPNAEGRRILELVPRQGWNAVITVYDDSGGTAEQREILPGIVLTLDGVEQPPTSSTGELIVEVPTKPQVLGVATEGWRLITRTSNFDWGSVFADTGEFTVEDNLLDVFLVRTNQ